MLELDENDPRVKKSDKTYVGFKARDMDFDAHLTIMYLGQISVLQERLAQTVIDLFTEQWGPYFFVERRAINLYGPNNDIPVVEVDPLNSELLDLRKMFENHAYLPNPSEFDWNPHITLKLEYSNNIQIPRVIKLDSLGLYA